MAQKNFKDTRPHHCVTWLEEVPNHCFIFHTGPQHEAPVTQVYTRTSTLSCFLLWCDIFSRNNFIVNFILYIFLNLIYIEMYIPGPITPQGTGMLAVQTLANSSVSFFFLDNGK